VGAKKSTIMWPLVDAFPDLPCQGVSLQAIVRVGGTPKETKNIPHLCILNSPFAQLPNYIVHPYPFLCKILFGLFGSVEDVPHDITEFMGSGHWWMGVKKRGRRVGKEKC
jgi:hypothetical protein